MASPNLKSLDFKTAGFWPETFKLGAYAIAFLGVLIAAWLVMLSSKRDELNTLAAKEATLRAEYDELQTKANNLPVLKAELDQIQELLKTLVTRLPNKNEIPGLVVDVSQAAINNGLQVDLFEPLDEVKHDFYAEKRINVRLRGSYHQLGSLFSDIAKQPRLVAAVINDMTLGVAPVDESNSRSSVSNSASSRARQAPNSSTLLVDNSDTSLVFTGSVRTYRYLSDEEENEIAAAKRQAEADAKKKRRGAKPAANAED